MMRLDKQKIVKRKLGFFFICFGLLCSVILMLKIFDLFVESEDIEAIVTKTYRGSGSAGSGGDKMNIEWVDLNGEIQTEGAIHNDSGLIEGDTYTIRVDKKTNSRVISSSIGSICMFLGGLICCVLCLWLMKLFYSYKAVSKWE